MLTQFVRFTLLTATLAGVVAAEKPRVFLTESTALQVSGDATGADVKGSIAVTGGTSPQNVEVMKAFAERCPAVLVTAYREKAEYLVRLDHEALNPTTPFTHGNKVAVFDNNGDLLYSHSSRLLGSAVKGACTAITTHARR